MVLKSSLSSPPACSEITSEMDVLLYQDFTDLNARVVTLPGLSVLQSLYFQDPGFLQALCMPKNETKYIQHNFSKMVLLSAVSWRLIHIFNRFCLMVTALYNRTQPSLFSRFGMI